MTKEKADKHEEGVMEELYRVRAEIAKAAHYDIATLVENSHKFRLEYLQRKNKDVRKKRKPVKSTS